MRQLPFGSPGPDAAVSVLAMAAGTVAAAAVTSAAADAPSIILRREIFRRRFISSSPLHAVCESGRLCVRYGAVDRPAGPARKGVGPRGALTSDGRVRSRPFGEHKGPSRLSAGPVVPYRLIQHASVDRPREQRAPPARQTPAAGTRRTTG